MKATCRRFNQRIALARISGGKKDKRLRERVAEIGSPSEIKGNRSTASRIPATLK